MLLLALFVVAVTKDQVGVSAVFALVSTTVASAAGYLTARTSSRTQVAVAQTTTRGQVEEAAFERAKAFYTDVIDRQQSEIREQATEIIELKTRVDQLEERVEHAEQSAYQYRRTAQRLARGLHQLRVGGAQLAPDPALDEAVIETLGDDPATD